MTQATELEFLHWFYHHADFGTQNEDLRFHVKNQFVAVTGKQLPKGYETFSDDGFLQDSDEPEDRISEDTFA